MDRIIEKKKWPPRKIISIAASSSFGLFLLYLVFFGVNKSSLKVKAERLTISTVEHTEFQEFIPITGTVTPQRCIRKGFGCHRSN